MEGSLPWLNRQNSPPWEKSARSGLAIRVNVYLPLLLPRFIAPCHPLGLFSEMLAYFMSLTMAFSVRIW